MDWKFLRAFFIFLLSSCLWLQLLLFLKIDTISAQDAEPPTISPKLHEMYKLPASAGELLVCGESRDESSSCPVELSAMYQQIGHSCATSYTDFLSDPVTKHFWVEDPQVTAQGKTNERARQFLDWALNTSPIDNSPVFGEIWRFTSTIALFGVVIIAAIFGIGYIVSQRTNYDFKISIWPSFVKIGTMLIYVALSYALVFTLVQLSEILMGFSLENLGGRELFNIYFSDQAINGRLGGSENSYLEYFGCRDLNIRVQEGIDSQVFMLQLTNVSYYVMGIMLILRKILLWFMLFVSPFLALLMPFIFIRNTGWIWIGVFFQWLFYGPLLSIFLGAMAKIWNSGIPWAFDFSRAGTKDGYIYPTGLFLVYGGPAQEISASNNANYIDTFAEYVIALIMIWSVTFFPWWLLRIFRDYCCDGIYASKNILMAMYDHMRNPSKPGGPITPAPKQGPTLKIDQDIPKQQLNKLPISSITEIKTVKTQDITKSLNLSMTKIVDIARFETNRKSKEETVSNLKLIANPVQASKPADRQIFMNLRSELFARAIKNDQRAQTILQATSTSSSEKVKIREMLTKSLPQRVSVSQIVSEESKISNDKVVQITNNFNKSVVNNNKVISSIARTTNTNEQTVQSIMRSFSNNVVKPVENIISTIANETNTTVNTVKNVLNKTQSISSQAQILSSVSQRQGSETKTVARLMKEIQTFVPVKSVSETTTIKEKETETIRDLQNKEVENISSKATQTNEVLSKISTVDSAKSVVDVKNTLNKETENLSIISKSSDKEISKLSQKEIETIKNVMQVTVSNEQVVQTVATETKLQPQQVRSVITSYASNVGETPEKIIERVKEASGVAENDVEAVMTNITDNLLASEEVVSEVASKENISPEEISNVMNKQIEFAKSPEKNIEKTIAIPQSISIEDYEEVKDMWVKQYEEGEVPVSESIQSRKDWVDQEIVVLTNTLNKILSGDQKLQQQGLDEVGYLLPIFLINSLKGEELIVYLKAKLEAAKLTDKILNRETELREKIKQEAEEEETQVFVNAKSKEEEKAMHMDLDSDKTKLKGIEERVKAVQEKLGGFDEKK